QNTDRSGLLPEKKRYEPGETAKFQLRMPFRKATVLVTVEREGVIDQKVVELDGASPVIELPIAGNYGPNVYVSALAVRGRVDPEVPGPYAWLRRMLYRIGYWLRVADRVARGRDAPRPPPLRSPLCPSPPTGSVSPRSKSGGATTRCRSRSPPTAPRSACGQRS